LRRRKLRRGASVEVVREKRIGQGTEHREGGTRAKRIVSTRKYRQTPCTIGETFMDLD